MPDPVPDSSKTWGVANVIWLAIVAGIMTLAQGWMNKGIQTAVETNGAEQVKHAKELKTEVATGLSNVAAKVDQNTAETAQVKIATQAIPPAAIVAARKVEEKADAKDAEQ